MECKTLRWQCAQELSQAQQPIPVHSSHVFHVLFLQSLKSPFQISNLVELLRALSLKLGHLPVQMMLKKNELPLRRVTRW